MLDFISNGIDLIEFTQNEIMYKVRVATMTHFCTFGTVTSVLIIIFG